MEPLTPAAPPAPVAPPPAAPERDGPPVRPREPEQLTVPAEEVRFLVTLALQTQLGAAWRRAFVAAHGYPSWLADGPGRVVAADAWLVPDEPRGG